jgi:3-oxoacyl-[acyl-carrier protein] reductase
MARLSKLSRSLNDKVAIVTGAASGMGRATAFLLADEGASVAVVDLDQAKVDAVVNAIQKEYGSQRAIGFAVDVRHTEQLQTVVDKTISAFGCLDIVINNAGISLSSPANSANDDFLKNAWEKNNDDRRKDALKSPYGTAFVRIPYI